MIHGIRYALVGLGLVLAVILPLSRLSDSAIEGYITDRDGPLAGASIEGRNVMTGALARDTSNSEGHYKLKDLQPGRYSLWVTAEGHDAVRIERIAVDRGETVQRDIRLNRIVSLSDVDPGETR